MQRRRIHPHCTSWCFLILRFLITVATNNASERCSLKQTPGTRNFQNCISLLKYTCFRKNYTHTHSHSKTVWIGEGCNKAGIVVIWLKSVLLYEKQLHACSKNRITTCQCPIVCTFCKIKSKVSSSTSTEFLVARITSELHKHLNYWEICHFDQSSELSQTYQMTYGKPPVPLPQQPSMHKASHKIHDLEYQNILLQDVEAFI